MLFDIINPASLVAEPFGRHFAAQAFDQSLSSTADDAREFNLVDAFENDVVRLHGVLRSERWSSFIEGEQIRKNKAREEREREEIFFFNPLDRIQEDSINQGKGPQSRPYYFFFFWVLLMLPLWLLARPADLIC